MNRMTKSVLLFGSLGAVTGACLPLLLGTREAVTYGLPYWLDDHLNPAAVLLCLTVPCGVFIGVLTGLATASSSNRFAAVRSLLAIAVPALFAMSLASPPPKSVQGWMWTPWLVGGVVAVAMTCLLVCLGYRQDRARSEVNPTSRAEGRQ